MVRSKTDLALLFVTRFTRLFAYGMLSVVLALYLAEAGWDGKQIGLLFTLTLLGDAALSLVITTFADRMGRRRMLVLGAILLLAAGAAFALTRNFGLLALAAIIGVISPSGNEIGPFLSIEQAALSQLLPPAKRTLAFSWYNLIGSFATACGALGGGWAAHTLQAAGWLPLEAYRAVLIVYALSGVLLAGYFACLSPAVEIIPRALPAKRSFGLHQSKQIVVKLSALFALDAFAGGFIIQSFMAYWFHVKFGVEAGALGGIFFGANILAGMSALLAARIAQRFGLINTMVFTHIPSNVLLGLVPLMPNLPLALVLLLSRFCISQMDVPTRQSYTMAVVAPDERSAASGVTALARSLGASLSPALSGFFLAHAALVNLPFFLAGALKIIYDVLLYRSFTTLRPPEEMS